MSESLELNNVFKIMLNSANAINGTDDTPNLMTFNMGSVYENANQLQRFQEADYCYVRVDYCSIEDALTGVGNVLINLNGVALPNSLSSKVLSTTNFHNVATTQLIGLMPTGNTGFTYSSNTFDNSYTKVSNLFNGMKQFELTDQDGTAITLNSSKPVELLLSVYFPTNPTYFNNNPSKVDNFY
tara:strand:- start:3461 stop:4012 length:552 start_codon:yes stop_codon:yes gene_type:complete